MRLAASDIMPILPMMSSSIRTLELATDDPQQSLVLTAEVLRMIAGFQQHTASATEAGGMLFAKIEPQWVIIQHASIPHPKDKRARMLFEPDLRVQSREIARQFKKGLHFVGEWHTHPEARPKPSSIDLASMDRCFATSEHTLKAFVMVIAGTAKWPDCLWISLHRNREAICLFPDHSAPDDLP